MTQRLQMMLMLVALLSVASCLRVPAGKDAIYRADSFEVYPDSIVRGETIFTASPSGAIEGLETPAEIPTGMPVYRSSQRMADALFAKALADTSSLFSVEEVALAAGFLYPEKSIEILRSVVSDGRVQGRTFPLVADLGSWAAAAWEIYCVTGSAEWLRESYDVLTNSLREQRYFISAQDAPLISGQGEWISDPADFYPDWMTVMDRYETVATAVNVSQACALSFASRMADRLNLPAVAREHSLAFGRHRSLINDRLWIPDSQRYGQCLYGRYYPILSTVSDNRANAACVLGGIATAEMSEALIASAPLLADGIPEVYPQINPSATTFSPVTQTLFALAAAKVRNPQGFTLAAASLMEMTLDRQLPALWPAVVAKGFFGINFTPDGITFRPMVPQAFGGSRELRGLRYRKAVIDISLHGTGDRIASFMLDSVSVRDARIPADLESHHKVEITLSGNDLPVRGINIVDPLLLPAPPQLSWDRDGLTGVIRSVTDGPHRYVAYVDGVMEQQFEGDTFTLPSKRPSVTAIVELLAPDITGFSPRSHVYAPGQSEITVHASSVTPRRPPLHFIKDRQTATNYIELAARHNTRITCYANVPAAGDYFLTVGYSNGSTRCALRTLSINDSDVATLLCPVVRPNDWITVHPSNTVVVTLREGPNKIALTYIGGTMLLNKITLYEKNRNPF